MQVMLNIAMELPYRRQQKVITMISKKISTSICPIKGEVSPVAVINLIFTGAILWASEGFITSIN
jgi:hypothetical protein